MKTYLVLTTIEYLTKNFFLEKIMSRQFFTGLTECYGGGAILNIQTKQVVETREAQKHKNKSPKNVVIKNRRRLHSPHSFTFPFPKAKTPSILLHRNILMACWRNSTLPPPSSASLFWPLASTFPGDFPLYITTNNNLNLSQRSDFRMIRHFRFNSDEHV